jgi:hypothetical protein
MNSIFIIAFYDRDGSPMGQSCVTYTTRADAETRVKRRRDDTCPFDIEERVVEYAPAEDFHRLADRATAMVGGLELQIMELQKQLGCANRALDTIRKGHLANSIN